MKWILCLLMLVILSSIGYASYQTYIVDEEVVETNKMLTFGVPHGQTGRQQISCLARLKESKRKYFLKYAEDQEELDRRINKMTKNWKTNVAPKSTGEEKWVMGYYEPEHKDFKRNLWFSIRHED